MKINHARLRRKARERLSGAAFLAPSFLGAAIFYILPFGVVVYYSLIRSPLVREFVGFDALTWIGRSLERTGDHVKNVCEAVIYIEEGADVRHEFYTGKMESCRNGSAEG